MLFCDICKASVIVYIIKVVNLKETSDINLYKTRKAFQDRNLCIIYSKVLTSSWKILIWYNLEVQSETGMQRKKHRSLLHVSWNCSHLRVLCNRCLWLSMLKGTVSSACLLKVNCSNSIMLLLTTETKIKSCSSSILTTSVCEQRADRKLWFNC